MKPGTDPQEIEGLFCFCQQSSFLNQTGVWIMDEYYKKRDGKLIISITNFLTKGQKAHGRSVWKKVSKDPDVFQRYIFDYHATGGPEFVLYEVFVKRQNCRNTGKHTLSHGPKLRDILENLSGMYSGNLP